MRLMGMRFKDFTWKDNPVSLRVAHARRVGEVNVPYGESKAEELGPPAAERHRGGVLRRGGLHGGLGRAAAGLFPKRGRGCCSCRG